VFVKGSGDEVFKGAVIEVTVVSGVVRAEVEGEGIAGGVGPFVKGINDIALAPPSAGDFFHQEYFKAREGLIRAGWGPEEQEVVPGKGCGDVIKEAQEGGGAVVNAVGGGVLPGVVCEVVVIAGEGVGGVVLDAEGEFNEARGCEVGPEGELAVWDLPRGSRGLEVCPSADFCEVANGGGWGYELGIGELKVEVDPVIVGGVRA